MLSLQLTLLRFADPQLLDQVEATFAAPTDRADVTGAVLALLEAEDAADDRYEVLLPTEPLALPVHTRRMRTTLAGQGDLTDWAIDLSHGAGRGPFTLRVTRPPGPSMAGIPRRTRTSVTFGPGLEVTTFHPGDGVLLVVSTAVARDLGVAAELRAAMANHALSVLASYPLSTRADRQTALADLLASAPIEERRWTCRGSYCD